MNIQEFLKQHKGYLTAVSYGLIFLIGALDYWTGYRLSFSIFYLIPIAIVAWGIGMEKGITMAAASTVVWVSADLLSRDAYPSLFVIMWNACVRMGFFATVTVILSNLKESFKREQKLARTDNLTNIANSHAFFELANEEIQRSQRYQRPLTLVYIDCDNFKVVNDNFGHEIGNELLRSVAHTIEGDLRAIDKCGRLGGDEFVILLPETGGKEAREVVKRVQQRVLEVMRSNKWPVTLSIGIATFLQIPENVDAMIKEADTLMYTAKRAGKNQIKQIVVGADNTNSIT